MLTAEHPGEDLLTGEEDDTGLRPVRYLVPTRRRGNLFLTNEDTLLANSLGITRNTTDQQLADIAAVDDGHDLDTVTRLRNGLAAPRDITEARTWGYHIPVNEQENSEEDNPDPNKRLGWWWVYHPTFLEDRHTRRKRYLADFRLVDTKGAARLLCRAYLTTRDRKNATDKARQALQTDDLELQAEARTFLINKFRKDYPGHPGTDADILPLVLQKAGETILRGTPVAVDKAGQSDMFRVCDVIAQGRKAQQLTLWYEFSRIEQSGRPVGAVTRRWGRRKRKP